LGVLVSAGAATVGELSSITRTEVGSGAADRHYALIA
jgi:hypothetical protein